MTGAERADGIRQDTVPGGDLDEGDVKNARRSARDVSGVFDGPVELDADPLRVREEGGPGGRQPDASGDALENGKPELLLKEPDLPGERRLSDVQALCGTMEML